MSVNGNGASEQVIVVADDDADVRDLIEFRLSRAGYRVAAGGDGEEALELIRRERPDLAVLDVMMPKLDGYEVTRRIRSDSETAQTPVLLLTASVREGTESIGFEAGANDHMRKPFSPRELLARVRSILAGA